jgi:acylphosphatase
MQNNLVAVRITIWGKVQGVFYRSTLRRIAADSRVVGWVKNLDDGNVEAFLQGKKENVDSVVEWCKIGPNHAKVERVVVTNVTVIEGINSFSILL